VGQDEVPSTLGKMPVDLAGGGMRWCSSPPPASAGTKPPGVHGSGNCIFAVGEGAASWRHRLVAEQR